jgi:hypothetical protein
MAVDSALKETVTHEASASAFTTSATEHLKVELKRARRRGLSAAPVDGWPLDHLLVGPATLKTTRQLLHPWWIRSESAVRAWDVALWSGVTPQGSILCMERLKSAGLLRIVPPRRAGHATTYRLVDRHPLVSPLTQLFQVEREIAGPMRGISRSGRFGR